MCDQVSPSARPGDRVPADTAPVRQAARGAAPIADGRVVLLHPAAGRSPRHGNGERRATRRAMQDWERLQTPDALPTLRDLSPILDSVDWADRFLLACDPEPGRSVFVLCGSRIEAAFGQRLIGRVLCDVVGDKVALLRGCADAVKTLRAVEVEDLVRGADNQTCVYRAVFMPMRGVDPDHLYLMGAYACDTVGR